VKAIFLFPLILKRSLTSFFTISERWGDTTQHSAVFSTCSYIEIEPLYIYLYLFQFNTNLFVTKHTYFQTLVKRLKSVTWFMDNIA
jgi:hypothetical protein